jgi:nicotinate-nucleotide--dimethylbenzimidazole phosphoribosyltransferase
MTPPLLTKHSLQNAIDAKAKPLGALGRIEDLAVQIGLVTGSLKPNSGKAALLVFAGDHGLTEEGISAYPSEVTGLVAEMVLEGTAGANIAARAAGADVFLIDAGLKAPLPPVKNQTVTLHAGVLMERRMGAGTANSRREPAMTEAQCEAALKAGMEVAGSLAADGYGIVAMGEIGIGNSSASALVAHAITGLPLAQLTGPGAGAPPAGMAHKLAVLQAAASRAALSQASPPTEADLAKRAVMEFAGFEMAMLTGAIIGAANCAKIAVVDGFIATACAAAAFAMTPKTRQHCIFAHRSAEPGHAALLATLKVDPLFDLGLRLGEGTGAALAVPFIRMAEALLRDMADLPGAHPAHGDKQA